jgi:hypothetical protein
MTMHESASLRPVEEAAVRLRLKRVFLRTLVLSLATCALVAVFVLLLGQFSELTGKVLVTLGALGVHSGMAMVCAHCLERRQWARLSLVALLAFGVSFVVLLFCTWWPGCFGSPTARATGMAGAFVVFYILAIPCADLYDRGVRMVVAVAGLAAVTVALGMMLVCIWAEPTDSDAFIKASVIMSIVAFSFAHTGLLLRVPPATGGGSLDWLLRGTLLCVWVLAALVSGAIIWEPDDQFWFRLMGAVGVLDATGSLALLILVKLRKIGKVEKLQTVVARVELRCPRCTALQQVDAGNAKCDACGLKFRIEIEEPRCAKCDYLLWQLPERRCPECGTAF